jgi:phosphoribosylaminoimidazolecarboxamide formyltransferase/IMP cyclohydrolase
MRRIERAILSCHDKGGLMDFARALKRFGVELVSTEGTQRALKEDGIDSVELAAYTGVREMLGGRVKSLHPKVHSGLLGLRDNKVHQEEMRTFEFPWVDLLVVNLQSLSDLLKTPGISVDEVVDQVDIGGVAMLRSAAKNFRYVTAVVSPRHYPTVLHEMQAHEGSVSFPTRFRLAQEAFAATAEYDRLLSEYLEKCEPPEA